MAELGGGLGVGGDGFLQKPVQFLLRLLLCGDCSHFFPPPAELHRGAQKQCFLLLIDQPDALFAGLSLPQPYGNSQGKLSHLRFGLAVHRRGTQTGSAYVFFVVQLPRWKND